MASETDMDTDVDTGSDRFHELLSDAIESLSEGFALYDDNRKLVVCNQKYIEMNAGVADLLHPGLDWEILMRESARRGIYHDAIGREDAWVSDRLQTTHDYVTDFELVQTDGTHYLVSTHPTKMGGFVVTRTDISDRKKAEAATRDGDLLIRTVLDASSAIVTMARVGDGSLIYRSPAARELFGDTKSARDHYVNPDDRADFVTELLAMGQIDNYYLRVQAKGREFPASISARIVEYRGEDVIVSSVVDLTKEVEAQQLIQQVLEACPIPLQMTKAATGETLFSSPETLALFGNGDSAQSYYVEAQERARYLKELRAAGVVRNRKAEYIKGDGTRFWGAVSAQLIDFKGEEVIVSSTRDMTDELALQEELAAQRELLYQNEKMSALGELLAGVAHELNNPLSIVVGHALMLQEDVTDPETQRRVAKIGAAAERCARIVKTFLAMARQRPTSMERVNLDSVIGSALDVAGYGQQQDGIQIAYAPEADLPEILADADQITQVVINLVMNAGQAIKTSGLGDQIRITARPVKARSQIEIAISDNGPGVPDHIRARIFEPFFTTKEIGSGTGIGLAFCHRIIHSHNGQIWLDGQAVSGSRFVIRLPAAPQNGTAQGDSARVAEAQAVGRVLVVDDEEDIGALIAEVLKREGYLVDQVGSGAQALERLAGQGYDVVLSDLNMPDVDGKTLFATLKREHPEMVSRIAFITGDTMGPTSQKTLQEAGRPYLEKPVAPEELRQLVQDIMAEGGGRDA